MSREFKIKQPGIDWLEFRLYGENIKQKLSNIGTEVLNKTVKGDLYNYIIQHRKTFGDGDFILYDIYFIDKVFYDKNEIEKMEKIGSINRIKNEKMSKKGIYITFEGECFNKVSILGVDEILKKMGYDIKKYGLHTFRGDFKFDMLDISVLAIYQNLEFDKFKKDNCRFWANIRPPASISGFNIDFGDDTLRVYNKKKDIIDKEKIGYDEYLEYNGDITRIEVEFKRGKFKDKVFYDLEDLRVYLENMFNRKLKKYLKFESMKDFKAGAYEFSKNQFKIKQKENEKYILFRQLFEGYYNKLMKSKRGKKFLKEFWLKFEHDLFNNKI